MNLPLVLFMPEIDGIKTLNCLKETEKYKNEKTPVIALTANAMLGAEKIYLLSHFRYHSPAYDTIIFVIEYRRLSRSCGLHGFIKNYLQTVFVHRSNDRVP